MAEVKWARAWQNLRVRTSRSAEDASNLAAVLDELGVRELGLADLLRVDRAALAGLVDQALHLADVGKLDAADRLLEALSRFDARSSLPPYLLAALRLERAHHRQAIEAGALALARAGEDAETGPFRAEILLVLGRAHRELGDLDGARARLSAAAALSAAASPMAEVLLAALEGTR